MSNISNNKKNIYRLAREDAGFTREQASNKMSGISPSMIEKIEYEQKIPTPFDVVQMALCYKRPELCNYYCNRECEIGKKYLPSVEEVNELPAIVLETVASLNEIYPLISRLIEISRDGVISNREIPDFAKIKNNLDQISIASDALNMWVEKTITKNDLDGDLLELELEKLSNHN